MGEARHAKWADWPHIEEACYRIRSRGRKSAFSHDGKTWIDSYGRKLETPGQRVTFHGGPLDGRSL